MDFGFRRNDLRAFDRIADRKQDAADILKTFENRLDQGKSKIWPEEKTFQLKSSKSQAKGEGSRPRRNPKSQRNLIQNETRPTGIRLASKAHGDSRTAKTKKKRGKQRLIIYHLE